jgi:ABC-type spermidine/putrescine transport system permease subunit I
VFFVVPLADVVWLSISDPSFGLTNYFHIFADPFHRQVLVRTLWTALLVTVICVVLGYPLAYVMGR